MNIARCLLFEADIPSCFWPQAVAHAASLHGNTPRKITHLNGVWKTPLVLEVVKSLPTFGEKGHSLVPNALRNGSWDEGTSEVIFLAWKTMMESSSLIPFARTGYFQLVLPHGVETFPLFKIVIASIIS